MSRLNRRPVFIILLLIWALTGCQQLQRGYYLTPDNLPTQPETTPLPTDPPQPPTSTSTPPSTVRALATATLTPLPTRPPATATPDLPDTLVPTITRTPVPCDDTEGQILTDSIESTIIGAEFRYRIYLPPCYAASNRRYPTVYMLHGLGGGMDDTQWDRMGLDEAADAGFADGKLPPMIIVMPNGIDADHHLNGRNAPFPEVIVHELIPAIDRQYCTWEDASARAIGGLSRGGFWAYWIALSNPDLFSRVGGHSAYLYEADFESDKNPNNIVNVAPGIDSLTMYFDHGGEAREINEVMPGVRAFIEKLRARGIDPVYIENATGSHDENYWSAHVSDYLTFYGRPWPRDRQELPSCHDPSPSGE